MPGQDGRVAMTMTIFGLSGPECSKSLGQLCGLVSSRLVSAGMVACVLCAAERLGCLLVCRRRAIFLSLVVQCAVRCALDGRSLSFGWRSCPARSD